MAKNLYNLTAVTTVNDSDLLHVNQGSVSSDKKVTKQNLLKEVNSSISSINNSLTNSFKVVTITGNVGNVSNGSRNYVELTYAVPSGYKTTGIFSIAHGHPGAGYPIIFGGAMIPGAIGNNAKFYLTYNAFATVASNSSDYAIQILCVPTSFDISVS